MFLLAPLIRWWWSFRRHPLAASPSDGTKALPPYSVVHTVGDESRVVYWSPDMVAVKKQYHLAAPPGTIVEFREGDQCRGRRFA